MYALNVLQQGGEAVGDRTRSVDTVAPVVAPALGGGANAVPILQTAAGAAGAAPSAAPSIASLIKVDPTIAAARAAAAAAAAASAAPALGPDGRPKLRVLFCGTHPIGQSNGYSRVTYYICRHLGLYDDIALTLYGFQKYNQTDGSDARNDIPPSVTLYDALAGEEPKRHGFGEKEIAKYIREHPCDILIIYNDPMVVTALTQTLVAELTADERRAFKLVSYADQVYPYQKPAYIKLLNDHFDAVIAFTPYWRDTIYELGYDRSKPCYVFPHGFDTKRYFPIPMKLARLYFNMPAPADSFVVLQLNRNTPRKRGDLMMMAWAEIVSRHLKLKSLRSAANPPKMIHLMIASQMNGSYNLLEIYEHELKRFGISLDVGRQYLLTVPRPQQMSDRDVGILYNACNLGLNTCEAEGAGLNQIEHSAVGYPQVASDIGGFKEYLKDGATALLTKPTHRYYIDNSRDGIGGIAEVSEPLAFADAIWKYYTNPNLALKHGAAGRRHIIQHYPWKEMISLFRRVLLKIGERAV